MTTSSNIDSAAIANARQTLERLKSAAPPATAQKLAEVLSVIDKLEQENGLLYSRWLDAEAALMHAPASGNGKTYGAALPAMNSSSTPNTDTLGLPPAPVHPGEERAEGQGVDFDTVFAQILSSRPQFDAEDAESSEGKPAAAGALGSTEDKNTDRLPRHSTDFAHQGTPNSDTLIQHLPSIMRPVLSQVRDYTADNARVRPFTETAVRIVDSYENLHDMRRGLFALKPFSVQPKDLLRQARKELLPRAAAAEHQVLILADDDLPQMYVDGERAYTILCDLLDNAIRYTPVSGTIRLTADSLGDHILFTVTDSGIGLNEDDIAQIGSPFWRALHQPLVARQPGAGLRLFIARRMLAVMGGELFISGDPGVGSSFSFTLPVGAGPLR
jgi:hypothetical protein